MNIRIGRHALIVRAECVRGTLSCLRAHSPEQLSLIVNLGCSLAAGCGSIMIGHFGLPLVRLVAVLSEDYLRELIDLLPMQCTGSRAAKLRFQSAINWAALTWTVLAILADDLLIIFPGHGAATCGIFLARHASTAL